MAVRTEKIAKRNLIIDGVNALVEKLGYSNAARFIATLGGKGDMTEEIRERRKASSIDDIVSMIEKRKAHKG